MRPPDVITSSTNPVVKRLRALSRGRRPGSESSFYCEGVQPVARAIETGADIELLVLSPELLSGTAAASLVVEWAEREIPVVKVSGDIFSRLSDRDGPAGVAAIVREKWTTLGDLSLAPAGVVIALHEVANPGNLGSIVRTAEAGGAAGVVLVGQTTDPYSPPAVKASMGSVFGVPLARERDAGTLLDWATRHGVAVAATTPAASVAIFDVVLPRPVVLLFGNEGTGLPPDVLQRSQVAVCIPMFGSTDSLNLSVAVGICLFEAQRRLLTGADERSPPMVR